MKKTLMTLALISASGSAYAETVQDFNKTVINRVPYNVEVCTNQTVGGDKTGDMLKGAIIGGMLGHNNSNATGGTKRVCEVQTRYNEESVTIYSHSVVTFYHEGKQYKLRFQK